MSDRQPVIFLYTEAAQLDARTRKAMVAAGFLPVKVATLDAVKIIELPVAVGDVQLSEVARAALTAVLEGGEANRFGRNLADRLLALSARAEAARKALGDA